jgi:hypothetical protein
MSLPDILQIIAALAILVPFAWSQLGSLDTGSALYLWLNFVGGVLLAGLAGAGEQWGFLMLEIAWALVAGSGLVTRARAHAR